MLSGGLPRISPVLNTLTASAQKNHEYFFPLFLNSNETSYSSSYYMITVDTAFAYNLGCELGTRDSIAPHAQDSVVVLDYSYPVCNSDNTIGN